MTRDAKRDGGIASTNRGQRCFPCAFCLHGFIKAPLRISVNSHEEFVGVASFVKFPLDGIA
jgi:hypothetical protein